HTPYLGLGPSAHSFDGTRRWWNSACVQTYCKQLSAGRLPVEDTELITAEQRRLEELFLGLRTAQGVKRSTLAAYPGSEKIIQRLAASALIDVTETRVVPTAQGMLVADSLPLLLSAT
ncbi:MAG: coproporphyrinogen III oxidase family protein, partial [Deltaproteobacteria bacterium]|nr:coproporphyrinogen III oxidase family protein [Deltaproteobacteria bacterium]